MRDGAAGSPPLTLRALGAGLPRTGTRSLQLALQRLLGGRCYHMVEVFRNLEEHTPLWRDALAGRLPDWESLFAGYSAAVDWPVSFFWRELVEEYPDAPVILSTRDSAEQWWRSVDATIAGPMRREPRPGWEEWFEVTQELFRGFAGEAWDDRERMIAAYERHNAEVRATVPPERLVDWRPGEGWQPLCAALGVPVPAEPFPRVNTTDDWQRSRELEDMLVSPLAGRAIGVPTGSFVIAEWADPGRRDDDPAWMAPLHVHYADDEAWYVLEGTLRFRLHDEELEAPAGAAVLVPRGMPHTFANAGRERARYLIVMPPRIARLVDELHAREHGTAEAVQALFRKYESELLE